jgi:hypothetical protein
MVIVIVTEMIWLSETFKHHTSYFEEDDTQILTVKIMGFWDVMLYSFVDEYQHARETNFLPSTLKMEVRSSLEYCYLSMKLNSITSQKTVILIPL